VHNSIDDNMRRFANLLLELIRIREGRLCLNDSIFLTDDVNDIIRYICTSLLGTKFFKFVILFVYLGIIALYFEYDLYNKINKLYLTKLGIGHAMLELHQSH